MLKYLCVFKKKTHKLNILWRQKDEQSKENFEESGDRFR